MNLLKLLYFVLPASNPIGNAALLIAKGNSQKITYNLTLLTISNAATDAKL